MGRSAPDVMATSDVLASIRTSYPGAEIVLTTSDEAVDGLNHDVLVPVPKMETIKAVAAGLAAAGRSRAIVTRTDTRLSNDKLAQRTLSRTEVDLGVQRRIQVVATRSRNPLTSFQLLHPSSLIQFGLSADLRTLWSAGSGPAPAPALSPGQAMCASLLSGHGRTIALGPDAEIDFASFATSIAVMVSLFDVFDQTPNGVVLPSGLVDEARPWIDHDATGFAALRAFCRDGGGSGLARLFAVMRANRARAAMHRPQPSHVRSQEVVHA